MPACIVGQSTVIYAEYTNLSPIISEIDVGLGNLIV